MAVYLVMVSSVDGKIARDSNSVISWSSKEDKKHFADFTKKIGCVVMGKHTFDTMGKPLPDRTNIVVTHEAEEYSKKFSEYKNLFFVNLSTAKEICDYISNLGFQDFVLAGGSTLNTLFAKEKMIDYFYLTVEPFIMGNGLSVFNDSVELNFELVECSNLNANTILLKYKVID